MSKASSSMQVSSLLIDYRALMVLVVPNSAKSLHTSMARTLFRFALDTKSMIMISLI